MSVILYDPIEPIEDNLGNPVNDLCPLLSGPFTYREEVPESDPVEYAIHTEMIYAQCIQDQCSIWRSGTCPFRKIEDIEDAVDRNTEIITHMHDSHYHNLLHAMVHH